MDGWRAGIGQGSEAFLQQAEAVSFSNGVILSRTHHLLIETVLFLAVPSTLCVGNGHHVSVFF